MKTVMVSGSGGRSGVKDDSSGGGVGGDGRDGR